ncbi:hypothetical protein HDU76_009997, partial [Blyttiomyces sp. JEL0837]
VPPPSRPNTSTRMKHRMTKIEESDMISEQEKALKLDMYATRRTPYYNPNMDQTKQLDKIDEMVIDKNDFEDAVEVDHAIAQIPNNTAETFRNDAVTDEINATFSAVNNNLPCNNDVDASMDIDMDMGLPSSSTKSSDIFPVNVASGPINPQSKSFTLASRDSSYQSSSTPTTSTGIKTPSRTPTTSTGINTPSNPAPTTRTTRNNTTNYRTRYQTNNGKNSSSSNSTSSFHTQNSAQTPRKAFIPTCRNFGDPLAESKYTLLMKPTKKDPNCERGHRYFEERARRLNSSSHLYQVVIKPPMVEKRLQQEKAESQKPTSTGSVKAAKRKAKRPSKPRTPKPSQGAVAVPTAPRSTTSVSSTNIQSNAPSQYQVRQDSAVSLDVKIPCSGTGVIASVSAGAASTDQLQSQIPTTISGTSTTIVQNPDADVAVPSDEN